MNKYKGVNVKDVPPNRFISLFAKNLEQSGKFEIPEWMDFVKTTTHKQLAPYEPNWLFIRAAAIARQIYLKGKGIGVKALRTKFGSRGTNGTISDHHYQACGKIVRYCIKQLEKMGLVETIVAKVEEEDGEEAGKQWTNGRRVSRKGKTDMDRVAKEVQKQIILEKEAIAKAYTQAVVEVPNEEQKEEEFKGKEKQKAKEKEKKEVKDQTQSKDKKEKKVKGKEKEKKEAKQSSTKEEKSTKE